MLHNGVTVYRNENLCVNGIRFVFYDKRYKSIEGIFMINGDMTPFQQRLEGVKPLLVLFLVFVVLLIGVAAFLSTDAKVSERKGDHSCILYG